MNRFYGLSLFPVPHSKFLQNRKFVRCQILNIDFLRQTANKSRQFFLKIRIQVSNNLTLKCSQVYRNGQDTLYLKNNNKLKI